LAKSNYLNSQLKIKNSKLKEKLKHFEVLNTLVPYNKDFSLPVNPRTPSTPLTALSKVGLRLRTMVSLSLDEEEK